MNEIKYELIRSDRKSIRLELTDKGLIVRAPRFLSKREIEKFIEDNREWIETKTAEKKESSEVPFTDEEIQELAQRALEIIPPRVEYYAEKIGVSYGRITIRNQRTRWGSCSSKKNLNFNCLLVLAPEEVMDSVIVHELCHIKEMNHSKEFYRLVYEAFPEYDKCNQWLKKEGGHLICRL